MNEEPKFSALDRQFGDFLGRLAGRGSADVCDAAMSVSRARAQGHVCITLAAVGAAGLRENLRASGIVGGPGDFAPLILDEDDRLYLRRYWAYEQQLAAAIRSRTTKGKVESVGKKITDLQELAAARAVRNNFTVITSGPGTGKTQTVKKILTDRQGRGAAHGIRSDRAGKS